MSQLLIDKIRKARLSDVKAGAITFTVRRPTDLEMLDINREGISKSDLLSRFVVDWNAKEIDLIPGGVPTSVDFSSELFMEWVADNPEVWGPIIEAVINGYRQHQEAMDEALKKRDDG